MSSLYEELHNLLTSPEISIKKIDNIIYQEGPRGFEDGVFKYEQQVYYGATGSRGPTGPTGYMGSCSKNIPYINQHYNTFRIECDEACINRKKQIISEIKTRKASGLSIEYTSSTDSGIFERIVSIIHKLFQNGEKISIVELKNVYKRSLGISEKHKDDLEAIKKQNDDIMIEYNKKQNILSEIISRISQEIEEIGGFIDDDHSIYIPRPSLIQIPREFFDYDYYGKFSFCFLADSSVNDFVEKVVS
jgi:hypothetical protein